MCGIGGIFSLCGAPVAGLGRHLAAMGRLIAHRGPDGSGTWTGPDERLGFVHRRLSIIDLSAQAAQPMAAPSGAVITYNGEIYNYLELRRALASSWHFRTDSDTETILAAYDRYGTECLAHLRGMFAFALWDGRRLLCARDRLGIKPFYYAQVGDRLYFASEIKAVVPFLPAIETDADALAEYLTFQYTLGERTLFKGVRQLPPGHALLVEDGRIRQWRYWDVRYDIDYDHAPAFFRRRLRELVVESVGLHLRGDVPVGSYVSGGIDSSLLAILAGRDGRSAGLAFHGRFALPGYDESAYARAAAETASSRLLEADITAAQFRDSMAAVIYHLDHPVAGPGAFPQYVVSRLARDHVKVVLGGQGGDEVFGGYARYLIAYFEQCIKAAIDGTYRDGNFVVTAESIIPNLTVLQEYKPLIRQFWSEGLFGPLDERYFRLVDRSADMAAEIDWSSLDRAGVFARFQAVFNSERNVRKEAYFDSMTHFDMKCLLPALLHVEDRMSMAHGLESRVPLLDHRLIEFAATVPADVKFKDGRMKHLLKQTFADVLPRAVLERRDKMGFPVPLKEWFEGELRDMINDIFRSRRAATRPFLNARAVLAGLDAAGRFSRKLWALLSLELWYQLFHDRAAEWRAACEVPEDAGAPALTVAS
ncbi:MAG: asparagine synthase (glutamine-hydrolyzing) [Rhodospirillaceae bacterium]|nr:asparagine synthase (glutamine-hydrolyzing) [Rhodospirillaceae bacterium]